MKRLKLIKWTARFVAVMGLGGAALPFSAVADIPRGVFCLVAAGVPCPSTVLSNPNVDGVGVRQAWADLEPTEGHFNWTFLDSEVARASAAGKGVLLRILTQTGKPSWVTAAVTAAGGQFFSFEEDAKSLSIPVFWDPTFLAKKTVMITALGAHFKNNPAVKIVAISFANANSEDWSVPHTPDDVTAWNAVGYTSQKMLNTGKTLIDAAMVAFPNQLITLAVAGDGQLDSDVSYVARNAIATARASWPGRLIVQKNSLGAFNPPAPGTGTVYQVLWDSRPDVAGQMLAAVYGDSTFRSNGGVPGDAATILQSTVDDSVAYGLKYLEIYERDVVSLPSVITYAHTALTGTAGSGPPAPKPPTGLHRGH
ncbi:MAG: beta-galactosidase [Chthoniobacterales bacterium]|nr:beta-galactosidase [Chthoniobacterales bacterium]